MRISDWSSACALPILGSAVVGRRVVLVGGVEGIGELVVLALADTPEGDRQPLPPADAFAFEIALEMRVEQLVVTQLVGGDVAADLSQHRLFGGRADRSEEHTSELQSLMRISYAVFCLKNKQHYTTAILVHITQHIHIDS